MEIMTLKNHLQVVLKPDSSSRSAVFAYAIKAGCNMEVGVPAGTAHFLEHMLFKGSATKTAKKINQDAADLGTLPNAYTSEDETKYYIQVQSKYGMEALDLLSDFFWQPALPEEEIEKEKQVIIEEIHMYADQPSSVSGEVLEGLLKRSSLLGTKKSVRKIQRSDLLQFYNAHYHTGAVIFVATGNFDEYAVLSYLERLNVHQPKDRAEQERREYDLQQKEAVVKRSVKQAHISWAIPVAGYGSGDEPALEVMATILGAHGNASSRLYDEIREEKGLAYAVDVDYESFHDRGYLLGYMGLSATYVNGARKILFKHLADLETSLVSAAELRRAIACLTGQLVIGMDDVLTQNDSLSYSTLYGLEFDVDAFVAKVEAVTADEVLRVAQKYALAGNVYVASVVPKTWSAIEQLS